MRWTVEGFSQNVLLQLGLDATDAVILRFAADFYLSGKMQKINFDGKEFFWLHYGNVLQELPILRIDKRQLSNKIDYMVSCGIMEKEVVRLGNGSRAYFRFNEEIFASLVCSDEFLKVEKKEKKDEAVEKAERSELKESFLKYYGMKALEVRGQTAVPTWGAKEASLLKGDTAQFGVGEMVRSMRLFFSDSVQEVAEFTRLKTKAGYSYTVFHGMLNKLTMAAGEVTTEPCDECGVWGKHRHGCSKIEKLREENQKLRREEEAQIKSELADVNIADMFNQAIGKKVIKED